LLLEGEGLAIPVLEVFAKPGEALQKGEARARRPAQRGAGQNERGICVNYGVNAELCAVAVQDGAAKEEGTGGLEVA